VERGVDLLALALLMATLRDWLVICQRSVPVVWVSLKSARCRWGSLYLEAGCEHAGCDYEVGDDEARHAKGEKDWLSGIYHGQA